MTPSRRRSIVAGSVRSAFLRAAACSCAVVVTALTGCTAFATVRSAEVRPGPGATVQGSFASPPGDDAAWFWSFDCAQQCDHAIPAVDVVFEYGWRPPSGLAYTLGFGVSGVHPYIETYVQLPASRRRPLGVGGRLGLPINSWNEHQIYGRLDVPLTPRQRLLLNPGVFYIRAVPRVLRILARSSGWSRESASSSTWARRRSGPRRPVWGRAERRSDGQQFGPTTRVFGTASLAVSVHRARAAIDGR
jgi:hypothetical protein